MVDFVLRYSEIDYSNMSIDDSVVFLKQKAHEFGLSKNETEVAIENILKL